MSAKVRMCTNSSLIGTHICKRVHSHTHSFAHMLNLFGLLIAVDIRLRLRLCHSLCTIFLFAPIMIRTWDASADVSIAWSVHHQAHSPLSPWTLSWHSAVHSGCSALGFRHTLYEGTLCHLTQLKCCS